MIPIIVYSFIFLAATVGVKLLDYLKENKLCPCFIKVPFTLMVLTAMIMTYFIGGSNIDLLIWGPFVGLLAVGNFLTGALASRKQLYYILGVISFVLAYIYSIIMLYFTYGLPDKLILISVGLSYVAYVLGIFYIFGLNIHNKILEFIYSFIIFVLLAFTYQLGYKSVSVIATTIFAISELILQTFRFADLESDLEYDISLIYLLGIVLYIVPKNIF